MPPKNSGKATKRVVPLFQSMYEDFHDGDQYHVNWPLIKSAERVGEYYSVDQVIRSMEYYFRMKTSHDLWDFISEINKYLERSEKEEKLLKELQDKMDATKKKLKEYES